MAIAVFIVAACWHVLVWTRLRHAGHPRSADVMRVLSHAEAELMEELRWRAERAELEAKTHFRPPGG